MEKEIYAKDDILCIKRGKESSIGSKIQIDIGRSGAINKKTHKFKLTNLFTGQVYSRGAQGKNGIKRSLYLIYWLFLAMKKLEAGIIKLVKTIFKSEIMLVFKLLPG